MQTQTQQQRRRKRGKESLLVDGSKTIDKDFCKFPKTVGQKKLNRKICFR
jgi:hypothetical protein